MSNTTTPVPPAVDKDAEIAFARNAFAVAAGSLKKTVADMTTVEQIMGRMKGAVEDPEVQKLRASIRDTLNPSLTTLHEKMSDLIALVDQAIAAQKLASAN